MPKLNDLLVSTGMKIRFELSIFLCKFALGVLKVAADLHPLVVSLVMESMVKTLQKLEKDKK